ncbi:MAG: nucleotide exchange factor GrpE [Pleurocapsa minor GSE-CHR-MK-17-07R]|nr:nucleotide exchange factor GrpE [Pleurocapsa minor GSE-CHR-MK 17-07R]
MSSENEQPVNDAAAEATAYNGTADGSSPDFEALKVAAQQYMEGWQRERAEFANYKRRTEQERLTIFQDARADVLKKIIPIVDDFDRAVANIPEPIAKDPWVTGTAMIQRKLYKLLEDFGVTPVDPTGEPFDPNFHEAVMSEDHDTIESGHVIEVMQRGFKAGDKMIRAALVKVAR